MQLRAKAVSNAPSSGRTTRGGEPGVPAAQRNAPDPPRWVERVRTDPWFSVITVAVDILYAAISVALAHWWTPGDLDARNLGTWSWVFVPIVIIVLSTRSMYRQRLNHRFLDDFEPMETSIAVSALATLTVILVFVPPVTAADLAGSYVRPSELIVRIWVCAAILMPGVRLVRSLINRYLRRKYRTGAPAIIVGSDPVAVALVTRMRQVPDYGLWPAGIIDELKPDDPDLLGVPFLGTTKDLESAVRATNAEELVVAASLASDEQLARTAHQAYELGLRVRVVPRLMDAVSVGARVEHLGGIPLMELGHIDPKGWQFAVKHVLGRTIAAVGLLVISPVFIALALAVKFSSPGPILFRQPRVGRDGKVFYCLKFRSMRPLDPAAAEFELKDGAAPGGVEGEDRRTRIGKFMRKTSLDELPQLLNVIKGDMALVGPRPERPDFVELFEMNVRRYGERHRVKAGITGWAQVHGLRGQTSIADRAEFDNYYIENWSLLLDIKILILTVLAVLRPGED